MSTPTATPRTDAAWGLTFTSSEFSETSAAQQMRDKCAELETELTAAQSERDLAITRVASILWSGAIDKHTCGDVQQWVTDYTAELARLRDEVERLTKAAVPLCIGAPIIGILAREGQYLSGDGQGLIAASDLFGNDPFARAERAEADTARLDWLEAHALPQHSPYISISDLGRHYNGYPGSFRQAIDAAMKPKN